MKGRRIAEEISRVPGLSYNEEEEEEEEESYHHRQSINQIVITTARARYQYQYPYQLQLIHTPCLLPSLTPPTHRLYTSLTYLPSLTSPPSLSLHRFIVRLTRYPLSPLTHPSFFIQLLQNIDFLLVCIRIRLIDKEKILRFTFFLIL
ncbi:hypothetical protein EYC80_000335 [Monilinia laxa]|uniref:Uncharacterized protein n=1 Tax=Monilinia laxa TaxID=61186 RepID=A0A5N6KAE1_MONLA|nr:hypothetical protein EYC80_000335 [Monilinia laxa]